ncbi:MAG: alanine racemase [Oscillospiraceae bacterium]|jgi:alanine racemase|nr:alanine racemase [Oscillospiraceae bacterium]
MHYRTNYLAIDPSALQHNLRALRACLTPGAAMMAVVKADGYGHGAITAARAALAGGADALAVALVEEGETLRLAGITAPILVLGLTEPAGAETAARLGLAQTVCDEASTSALAAAARKLGVRTAAHLKLDTGMGRIGVRDAARAAALATAILQNPHLTLAGVFTHFACADEPSVAYTDMQRARFARLLAALPPHQARIHSANSAAFLRFPDTQADMVRCGIAFYGAPPVPTAVPLRQAMRWVTRAVYVKDLPAGESVSYGAAFTAQRSTRLMTLPVGYADGYRRCLAGRAQVLVRGRRAPVVGRVCMDQCMADVTDIPGCQAGDEVVLLGGQNGALISAEELAAWMGTVSYEAFLAPSGRVPKVII